MKITVVGNCQSQIIAECMDAMIPDAELTAGYSRDIREGKIDIDAIVRNCDYLFIQTAMWKAVTPILDSIDTARRPKVVIAPTIFYSGFHPDLVYAKHAGGLVAGPLSNSNSAIVLYGWLKDIPEKRIVEMFNDDTYKSLGYYDYKNASDINLIDDARALDLDLSEELKYWSHSGCFVHNANHPHLRVMAGMARVLLDKAGLKPALCYPEHFIVDRFAAGPAWPIYPEIGEKLGLPGEYRFKRPSKADHAMPYDLQEFVARSLEAYAKLDAATVDCTRFVTDDRYRSLFDRAGTSVVKRAHPYKGLPNYHFWNKVVATPAMGEVDPVVRPRFKIDATMRIATAGSCFAQHIAQALARSGFNYHIEERGDDLTEVERKTRQYGVYSARYGNIYTAAQLSQLIERALGRMQPVDTAWQREDGRYVDPFRPEVEPAGFANVQDVETSRAEHFAAVRAMLGKLDVFVFTLGLTEAWRSKVDGAVFPLAPGVSGGMMDPERYEFHNYTVEETVAATSAAIAALRTINPKAKVLLTVSPVPLAATYELHHVLVSTTYSKSVLRVAAQQLVEVLDDVDYFPSYEIITGAYTRGSYFEEDLRTVTHKGVAHVMDRFLTHYTISPSAGGERSEFEEGKDIICEEELLARF